MTSEGERVDRLRYLMDNAVGADLLPPAWREIANAAPYLLDVVEAARRLHTSKGSGEYIRAFEDEADAIRALDSHLSAARRNSK